MFAVLDPAWTVIVPAVCTAVTGAVIVVVQVMGQVVVQKIALQALERAKEVKRVLEMTTAATNTELHDLKDQGQRIHKLVNSAMTVQLELNAVALRRIATLTNDPDDEVAAKLAEAAHDAHVQGQVGSS